MMGHLTGVAKQIQSEQSTAIPIHCFAPCLNLCLQDEGQKMCAYTIMLWILLTQLIRCFPKRSLIFQLCKQKLSIGGTGLWPLCPTRWTVRTGAISVVYPALQQALQTVSEISYDDYGQPGKWSFGTA